jgi:hypothetical protein
MNNDNDGLAATIIILFVQSPGSGLNSSETKMITPVVWSG